LLAVDDSKLAAFYSVNSAPERTTKEERETKIFTEPKSNAKRKGGALSRTSFVYLITVCVLGNTQEEET
jgi:hypothetical protein